MEVTTDREPTSPERTKVRTHNKSGKVAVVYYLSRNGQLEHPHFIEVPLSSPDGLYLRDVIDRLNSLRGKGMARMYSWSSKRSYKNGFVWHDLTENDFIYPAHGQEYVLKGSELVDSTLISPENKKSVEDLDFPVVSRRRNQSWSAIEYKVYKAESTGRIAADASTQTDDKRRLRRSMIREVEENQNESVELTREEISPPPSDSSPETLESLMKADGRLILRSETEEANDNPTAGGARVKASSVLMQLISCGSISFRDCGPGAYGKDIPGLSLISHHKSRLPRGGESLNQVGKGPEELAMVEKENTNKNRNREKQVVCEDKEYFSGSLIETNKDQFPALKKSSSYNADQ